MHEMSLAQSLLDLATEHAGGHPIRSLKVRVGALSGVVIDSLSFCFEFVSQDTLAEGARLIFEHVPVTLVCRSCGAAIPTDEWSDLRPNEAFYLAKERGCACGSTDLKIAGGFEFQLVEIEIEDKVREGAR